MTALAIEGGSSKPQSVAIPSPSPCSSSSAPSILSRLTLRCISASSAALMQLHSSLIQSSDMYQTLFQRIRALPITDFYLYMWRVDPTLFMNTMFVNYLLPLIMEAMPWYLSRRKISRMLRESRNSITHRLVANEAFSDSAIASFVLFSLVYAFVQTIEQVLRTRVLLSNRLLIKRLVLERILYSELGSLQERYLQVFGEEVRTDQLEQHVFNDISETLNLFNTTLPSLLRGLYTLIGSSHDLWLNKEAFDILAIIRPSIVGLSSEVVNYFREKYIVDVQTIQQQRNASAMSRVVTNIVDGLAEIQINNMQRFQLHKLDQVSGDELTNQQGMQTFVNNIYRQVSNRSVFDFASEVYVVRLVMNRRRINHETYRKVQNDIDYVTRLFGRLWSQARDGYRVYETQERVIALLNLPSFIDEARMRNEQYTNDFQTHHLLQQLNPALKRIASGDAEAATTPECGPTSSSSPPSSSSQAQTTSSFEFESLLFRRCVFRYKPSLPLALNVHPRSNSESSQDVDVAHELNLTDINLKPPTDLRDEIDLVLSQRRVPNFLLRSSTINTNDILAASSTLVASGAPDHIHHAHSAIMSDLVQSEELPEDDEVEKDEEEQEKRENDIDMDVSPAIELLRRSELIRELETLVRDKQQNNERLALITDANSEIKTSIETESKVAASDEEKTGLPKPSPTVRVPSIITSATPSPPGSVSNRVRSSISVSCSPQFPASECEPGTLLFERGHTYSLVGENRSGKSTLMQILCKLYQPSLEDSEIILNGSQDFTTLPRMMLRDRVSYIAQRPFIFPGTIEENIRIGNTRASNEEVHRAAEMAGIFSMEKPKPISASGAAAGKSLLDRTGAMNMVAKPWEQNRLKNILMAAGKWGKKLFMKMHGFDVDDAAMRDEDEDEDGDVAPSNTVKPSASSGVPREQELLQMERDYNEQEMNRAAGFIDASEPSVLTPLPTSNADSSAIASTSSTSSNEIHPTLLMETAERGANLSGGFAQSVALARVFLRKEAQIIILDEAMGQMDGIKKRELIFPRLFEFVHTHRMTLILISHDVPLVCKLVDTVYVMSHGECVQAGTHQSLVKEKGAYARLVGQEDEADQESHYKKQMQLEQQQREQNEDEEEQKRMSPPTSNVPGTSWSSYS